MDSLKRSEMFARGSPRTAFSAPLSKKEIQQNSVFLAHDSNIPSWTPSRSVALSERANYSNQRFVQAKSQNPSSDTNFSGGETLEQKRKCMTNLFVKGQNYQMQLAKQQLDQTQPNIHRIQAPGAFLGYRF